VTVTVPTVFVLGAGASQPFGLPLGSELRQNIINRYTGDQGRVNILLNTTPFNKADTERFISTLRFSGLGSVDAFLERRPEFMDIGKAMMGIELLHGEAHDALWHDANNWLTYLFGSMIGNSLEEFADNKVSFVTFNYDRTVEHFLFVCLKNTFGRSIEETGAVVEKLPIVHLHGRLGHLPWQNQKATIEFADNQIDVRKMEIVTRQIKVVHEELTDGRDRDFELAHELLSKAEKVYLLGFGFGSRNVERLKLIDLAPKLFQGTAFGLTQKEANNCRMMCSSNKALLYDHQCLQFLREIAELN
jgi:hypothetical protein